MGPVAEVAESEEPLQQVSCIGCSGHQKIGREPEPHCHCKKCNYYKKYTVILTFVVLVLIIAVIVLAVWRPKLPSTDPGLPAGPTCPDSWNSYQGKCYYFSETERNWNNSQKHCSALGASLAGIDSEQELMFLLRYKGVHDYWIGLRREQGQPWKWTNGTEFNHLFVIRGGGDCVYLHDDEKEGSGSRCSIERWWICSKPEVYVMGKGTALEGSSK